MKSIAAILSAALLFASPVQADEIAETIQEALQHYQNNDLSRAKQSLDYASQMISQKNAEGLSGLLPPAMAGWEAEDGESAAVAMAMFGGGIHASRIYTKGDSRIELSIIGDSPLLAQFIPMFANPALAGAMGKPLRIGSQMALEDKEGEIKIIVANRFIVTVAGDGPRDDKLAYAKAIDFDALAKF